MSTEVGKIGLYLVNGHAGSGLVGAPTLSFSLLVNAVTGDVTGHAQQTQAVAPPGDVIKIGNVTGHVRYTGLAPTPRSSRCREVPWSLSHRRPLGPSWCHSPRRFQLTTPGMALADGLSAVPPSTTFPCMLINNPASYSTQAAIAWVG